MQLVAKTLTIPDGLYEFLKLIDRNLLAIVGVITIAIVVSVLAEVVKRHYTAQQREELAKKAVKWVLLTSSSVFTIIGYVIFFLQSNEAVLKQVPYIGEGIVSVLGVCWAIYNFRLKSLYVSFAAWANKWTDSKPATTVTPTPVQPVQSTDPSASDFS